MNDDADLLMNLLAFNNLLNGFLDSPDSLEQLQIFYDLLSQNEKISYLLWQLYNNFLSTYKNNNFVPVSNQDVMDSFMTGNPLVYVSSFSAGFVSFLNTPPDDDGLDTDEVIALVNQYKEAAASVPLTFGGPPTED